MKITTAVLRRAMCDTEGGEKKRNDQQRQQSGVVWQLGVVTLEISILKASQPSALRLQWTAVKHTLQIDKRLECNNQRFVTYTDILFVLLYW